MIRQYPGRIYDAYNNRGKYYFDTGRYAEALGDYEQAIALEPKLARTYFSKGSALGRLGQLDAALASLDYALELDPSLVEARSAGPAFDSCEATCPEPSRISMRP